MSHDIHNWIINWFAENSAIDNQELLKSSDENYFEREWIDSLQFIQLLTDIEDYFGVEFDNEEFQNREFVTINGLSNIIKGHL